MSSHIYFTAIILIASTMGYPSSRSSSSSYPFPFVTRDEWGAQPPTLETPLTTPVPYVVIHHTYIPGVCKTKDACMADMRAMQNVHQDINGWTDIGYNFGVGGEGSVYEGRGWNTVGAHSAGWNSLSIGIVLIGDWVSNLPPPQQLEAVKQLIGYGVEQGYIRPDYDLIGHRQVSATECPGETLFKEISNWEHFTQTI